MYVPSDKLMELCLTQSTQPQSVQLNISYQEIVSRGIITWCMENIPGSWSILGKNTFSFEDSSDALVFKIQFFVQ